MSRLRAFGKIILSLLREIGDENAYARHLAYGVSREGQRQSDLRDFVAALYRDRVLSLRDLLLETECLSFPGGDDEASFATLDDDSGPALRRVGVGSALPDGRAVAQGHRGNLHAVEIRTNGSVDT